MNTANLDAGRLEPLARRDQNEAEAVALGSFFDDLSTLPAILELVTAFSMSISYLFIYLRQCRQRIADLLRNKDCRAATLCRQRFQNLNNVINWN